jgi:hypothetical protein
MVEAFAWPPHPQNQSSTALAAWIDGVNEPRDVERDPDEHNGDQEIPEGVAVFVARHRPGLSPLR